MNNLTKRQEEVLSQIFNEARFNFFKAKSSSYLEKIHLGDFALNGTNQHVVDVLVEKGLIVRVGRCENWVSITEGNLNVALEAFDVHYGDLDRALAWAAAANANGGVLPESFKQGLKG